MGHLPFEDRYAWLEKNFGPSCQYHEEHVVVVEQTQAKDRDHVLETLKEFESEGGEGLMLRKPGSLVLSSYIPREEMTARL